MSWGTRQNRPSRGAALFARVMVLCILLAVGAYLALPERSPAKPKNPPRAGLPDPNAAKSEPSLADLRALPKYPAVPEMLPMVAVLEPLEGMPNELPDSVAFLVLLRERRFDQLDDHLRVVQ